MSQSSTQQSILPILQKARQASKQIAQCPDEQRKALLTDLAARILRHEADILRENEKDLVRMEDSNPKKDRLRLTPQRIAGLAQSLSDINALEDPTGQVLREQRMENGLHIQKISVPLGVVGIIYESRPNVTVDVAALCLRAGNAVVLRGGSDAIYSNTVLVDLVHDSLKAFDLQPEIISLLPTDRSLVQALLNADQYVDILIPRGSQQLIDFVRQNASVPTIETGAGVCHTYVTATADLDKAAPIVVNAKVSRPSVCNSLDTVLVDEAVAADLLPRLIPGFHEYEVEVFADEKAHAILKEAAYPHLVLAETEDFGREFLSYKCSIKVVSDIEEALEHISTYSSRHSEAIVSEDQALCEYFMRSVDAAAVFSNASTRFTDGGMFGLGAEMGISTQKLHARGPFALEKLTTEKWVVRGNGQIRA